MDLIEVMKWIHGAAGAHLRKVKNARATGFGGAEAEREELELLLAEAYRKGYADGSPSLPDGLLSGVARGAVDPHG